MRHVNKAALRAVVTEAVEAAASDKRPIRAITALMRREINDLLTAFVTEVREEAANLGIQNNQQFKARLNKSYSYLAEQLVSLVDGQVRTLLDEVNVELDRA